MGFNSAFKGLNTHSYKIYWCCWQACFTYLSYLSCLLIYLFVFNFLMCCYLVCMFMSTLTLQMNTADTQKYLTWNIPCTPQSVIRHRVATYESPLVSPCMGHLTNFIKRTIFSEQRTNGFSPIFLQTLFKFISVGTWRSILAFISSCFAPLFLNWRKYKFIWFKPATI